LKSLKSAVGDLGVHLFGGGTFEKAGPQRAEKKSSWYVVRSQKKRRHTVWLKGGRGYLGGGGGRDKKHARGGLF